MKLLAVFDLANLLKKLNNKVYEVETSSEDEFKQDNVMIVNIKMGANGKIYRIISESEPRGYNFSVVKAGLEELYMYYVSLQSYRKNSLVIHN